MDERLVAAERLLVDADTRPQAAAAFEAVLADDPTRTAAFEGLVRVWSLERDGARLCDVLDRQAQVTPAGAARAELRLRIARVAYAWLADPDGAAAAYEAALAEPEGGLETAATALRALTELRTRPVDLDRMRGLLDARLKTPRNADERAGLLALRGELWRARLGHVENARHDFEAALALAPSEARAHFGLGAVAADRGDVEAAVDHFHAALEGTPRLTDDEAARAFDGLRRGLDKLGRADELPALCGLVLDAHPACRPVLEALDALLARSGRWDALLARYRRACAADDDPTLAARLDAVARRAERG
ncbi:MAG: tetratricopeptide repeat protein [Myxococcales bacterium]|nr:tetratricopeptide repeat protein [Myxococcales bacterium]